MHKSSFQSMEKFKDNYLNTEDSLNILDIGSYDASDTSYNYGRFLREDNWKYQGMDIQEGPNVDIVVSDIYNWIEIEDNSFGMKQIANYVGLQILECYVNDDEISYPWYDCVLIARKQYGVNNNLEKRMDNLENKLDLILKKINE